MQNIIFHLGLGALFTHELDAMTQHEWRILPLIQLLPEPLAMHVFVFAHIPLFALIVYFAAHDNARIQQRSRLFITGFLMLHGILHSVLSHHPLYEFHALSSHILIVGGAVLGGIYWGLELYKRSTH